MAQPTVVIQVEGVLRKPVTAAVLEAGRRLYHGLASTYRIVLVTSSTDRLSSGGWLGMNGFSRHDHIVYGDEDVPATSEWWVSVAKRLKLAYGYDTELFVVPDPHDAMQLIRHGFSVMLFVQAAYAIPEWRPDHRQGVRPWAELTAEVEVQRALRAGDNRMQEGF